MANNTTPLLDQVADYYSEKLSTHGETPQGVDWNGKESQFLRFEQLCKIIPKDGPFSVADLGCGYAALFDYLDSHFKDFQYLGLDVAADMIDAAQTRLKKTNNSRFIQSGSPDVTQDYMIASGIFNVRLENDDHDWLAHIKNTLNLMHENCTKGFSFNCLTSYSDADKMRDYLYYADPAVLFDYCKCHFSRNVALLHDYDLYEFTMIVRKG